MMYDIQMVNLRRWGRKYWSYMIQDMYLDVVHVVLKKGFVEINLSSKNFHEKKTEYNVNRWYREDEIYVLSGASDNFGRLFFSYLSEFMSNKFYCIEKIAINSISNQEQNSFSI